MQEHNEEKTNHCGPSGNNFISRLVSAIVKDTFLGVYLGDCCEEHDIGWNEGANKNSDEKFQKCIRCKFKEKFKNHRIGLFVSNVYFLGVRFGNLIYKIFGK